ncbi:PD40 domain-containing protein, partial [bacterium]|nr:PD40 domain-containing protein [bacterium]
MKVQTNGYYRFPAVHKDQVVFISEDDLWQVTLKGGVARRLTSNLGPISHPKFSEDGKWIAFTGREEGNPEIYLMPAEGGLAERITYLGCMTYTVGWHEGKIVFASDSSRPFMGQVHLHTIDPKTKEIEKLPFGPAQAVSFNKKCAVLGREIGEPSRWKRYRGGRAGKLWVDREGKGEFGHLKNLEGNIAFPMWVDERIFYVSDQAGFGNIFSCLSDGTDNKQHTRHKKFYVRSADTDGKNIVYQNGADLYCYNIESDKSKIIEVDFFSPRVQLKQKFTSAQQYLDNYAINSDGSSLAVVTRGKAFSFGNWEGPVTQHGDRHRVRYRLIRWMPDDKSIVLTSDVGGVDRIEFYFIETNQRANVIDKLDIGRPQDIKISPDGKKICLMNHRHELSLIDIASKSLTKIDQSQSGFLRGFNWSPDSNWIAYCKHVNHQQCIVKLHDVKKKEIHDITRALLIDFEPVFDPKGRYLYFLASRVFDPVWDNMHFDYNFPRGERPFLITLRKDEASPFVPKTKGFGAALNNDKKGDEPENKKNEEGKGDDNDKDKQPEELRIDFEGIQDRVIQFPVAEGLYSSIAAKDDKVFYTSLPISGTLAQNWGDTNPNAKGTIKVYDFNKLEESTFSSAISNFQISGNGAALAYRSVNRLRVVDASHDPKQDLPKENTTSRKTGWINLNRLKLAIDPLQEWKQMYKEAWRLQRDYYWVENMSSIDWKKIYDRYYPLLNRVGSRIEFSDLLWEMQGELGTSHAYEMGGDHKKTPMYII